MDYTTDKIYLLPHLVLALFKTVELLQLTHSVLPVLQLTSAQSLN